MPFRDPPPGANSRFVHEAFIYRAEQELVRLSVAFLQRSVSAGEPALVAVTGEHERALLDGLGDLEGITRLPRDHYCDPLAALLDERRRFADLATKGAECIRIVSEPPHEPWGKWLRYEAATNDVFAGFPVVSFCPHDGRRLSPDVLADVARTHPLLVRPDGAVVHSPLYEQPGALLAERSRKGADPLEAMPPAIILVDPDQEQARSAVAGLAAETWLSADSADAVRLATGRVVHNAIVHGEPPVCLLGWAAAERVVVTVTDRGSGPVDPYMSLLPADVEADLADANSLCVVSQALSDLTMFSGPEGFTVRLVERA